MLHFVQMMLPSANDVVLRTNDGAPCGRKLRLKSAAADFFHLNYISPLVFFGHKFLRKGADCPPQPLPQTGGGKISTVYVILIRLGFAFRI